MRCKVCHLLNYHDLAFISLTKTMVKRRYCGPDQLCRSDKGCLNVTIPNQVKVTGFSSANNGPKLFVKSDLNHQFFHRF